MHSVPCPVFDAREVAIEFLGPDGLSHLVKQFPVIFRSSHLPVSACVDVGDVEHRDGAFDVVDDFQHFF